MSSPRFRSSGVVGASSRPEARRPQAAAAAEASAQPARSALAPRPWAAAVPGERTAKLELIARRFAVLSDPLRLRLLHCLSDGERSVTALVRACRATQPNVSRHLQTLAAAGLVVRRRRGVQVLYSVADGSVYRLCDLVCGSLEKQLSQQAELFHRA